MADELGDLEERDRLLDQMLKESIAEPWKIAPSVRAMRDGLAAKDGKGIDPVVVSKAVRDVPMAFQDRMWLAAAKFLHNHGAPEDAKRMARQIVEWPEASCWSRTMGTIWLRRWEGRSDPTERPR